MNDRKRNRKEMIKTIKKKEDKMMKMMTIARRMKAVSVINKFV